jgi:NAD(P)-dependent dehydrogenase (short-subunit alcohol dehydrogenase family)
VDASVSVVTGGSSGIGLAVAERLASDGGCVAIVGRRPDVLEEAEMAVKAAGAADVLAAQADAGRNDQVRACFQAVEERWGSANVLVNTIGPGSAGRFDDLDDDDWASAFDDGVITAVRIVRHAVPLLRRAPWARIVNVTAMSVQHQSAGLIAYTAAKAALGSMTKNLAKTLAPEEILVNAVAPGAVLTGSIGRAVRAAGGDPDDPRDAYRVMSEQFGASIDLGRVALPTEVAEVIAFCASRSNTFMTGATLNVDGGSDFL